VSYPRLIDAGDGGSIAPIRCIAVRTDKPLPGDLVIRARREAARLVSHDTFVVTTWPDVEAVVGGPYQSYGYALVQARRLVSDRERVLVWRDHAKPGEPEQLEEV
jgi:hypothetical protein